MSYTGDYLIATTWFHVSNPNDGHDILPGSHSGAEFLSFVSKILKVLYIKCSRNINKSRAMKVH